MVSLVNVTVEREKSNTIQRNKIWNAKTLPSNTIQLVLLPNHGNSHRHRNHKNFSDYQGVDID